MRDKNATWPKVQKTTAATANKQNLQLLNNLSLLENNIRLYALPHLTTKQYSTYTFRSEATVLHCKTPTITMPLRGAQISLLGNTNVTGIFSTLPRNGRKVNITTDHKKNNSSKKNTYAVR